MPAGPSVIEVCGAVASTVQVRDGGDGSVLPAASVGADRERVLAVLEAAVDLGSRASRTGASGPRQTALEVELASGDWKPKLATREASVEPSSGPAGDRGRRRRQIDVEGALRGARSRLPTASVARTSRRCTPSPRAPWCSGELHGPQPIERRSPGGTRRSSPARRRRTRRSGSSRWSGRRGPTSIELSGAVRSTRQRAVAGVGSSVPVESTARDLEGVGALGDGPEVDGRGADRPWTAVERALEGGRGVGGRELEVGVGRRGVGRRRVVDQRVGADRVDAPSVRQRRLLAVLRRSPGSTRCAGRRRRRCR